MFKRHYSKWRAGVLAIGGDQTAHLLWRLRNGEVPVKRQPKVVVMLIGTNDLGAAVGAAADVRQAVAAAMLAVPGIMLRCVGRGAARAAPCAMPTLCICGVSVDPWHPLLRCQHADRRAASLTPSPCCARCPHPPTPSRLLQTLHTLKDMMPNTHVVVLGVLPRGGPGPAGLFAWPSAFTEAAEIINSHFRWAPSWLACGARMEARSSSEVVATEPAGPCPARPAAPSC